MKPVSLAELTVRLSDGVHVCLARKDAIARFGGGRDDFLKSFWCAFLLFPLFLLVIYGPSDGESIYGGANPFIRFAAHTLYYVIAWTYWPLIMSRVADGLGKPDLWLRYVVVSNWAMVTPFVLQLLTYLLIDGFAPDAVGLISTGLLFWSLFVNGWILRTLFQTTIPITIGLVVADFLLGRLTGAVEHLIIVAHSQ